MRDYSEYTIQYVQEICNALNENGFTMHEMPIDKPFVPQNFDTLTEFLQRFIVKPIDLYTFLNDKGLVNRGRCPYTGQPIDKTYYWSFMKSRWIYLSLEGETIMMKEHDEIHLNLFGTPRPRKEEREFMTENTTKSLQKIKKAITLATSLFWIVAIIWLALLGKWGNIGYGFLLTIGMSLVFPIVNLPRYGLDSIIIHSFKRNNYLIGSFLVIFNYLYASALIIFWTFLVFKHFTTSSSHTRMIPLLPWIKSLITSPPLIPNISFIPILFWGYSITLAPLLYMARKDQPEGIANFNNTIGIFIAIISYITLLVMWIT